MPAYVACARQIQRLVQLRFDEISLVMYTKGTKMSF
jgi:hypothetical protein